MNHEQVKITYSNYSCDFLRTQSTKNNIYYYFRILFYAPCACANWPDLGSQTL